MEDKNKKASFPSSQSKCLREIWKNIFIQFGPKCTIIFCLCVWSGAWWRLYSWYLRMCFICCESGQGVKSCCPRGSRNSWKNNSVQGSCSLHVKPVPAGNTPGCLWGEHPMTLLVFLMAEMGWKREQRALWFLTPNKRGKHSRVLPWLLWSSRELPPQKCFFPGTSPITFLMRTECGPVWNRCKNGQVPGRWQFLVTLRN